MFIQDRAIPLDSIVVVIGANGFVGLETCEKLLVAGYRVRGTVRDIKKHSVWMHNMFDKKWPGKFELVAVADFEEKGAFDEAFRGAAGVIYVSTPIVFHPDPTNVVDPNIRSTINTLEAAARAGVQRYVLSSSSKAVETTRYDDTPRSLTAQTYNWDSILEAYQGSNNETFKRMLDVYSAGRTLAELSFWSWIAGNKPPFVANCVVPDGNFGRGLVGATSSNKMFKAALAGEWSSVPMALGFLADVEDTSRLIVAAVAKYSLSNDRIFAYYKHSTWDGLREKVRKIRPELVKGSNQCLPGTYLSSVDGEIERAENILKEIGQPGFTTEDDMLQKFLDTCF